ncbi:Kelch-like protein 17 (Actinfilin) [Durusdinium trenchii]|uniref:Kelch-like protein 17 (Actinfilin) n=1 Tax=Durusdinium trenchii TaxID=1381693 RepID=A0ABP0M306_9DINO
MKMMAASRSPEKVEVNGDPTKGRTDDGEEDTLSKARKAAKVHLNALKEHMEEAMEAFNRLEGVIFTAAEAVKTERVSLMEDRIAAAKERQMQEAELAHKQEQLQREQDELRRAREQLELERRQLKELKTQQVAQAQAAHTVATHAVAAGNVQVAHAAHSVQALQAHGVSAAQAAVPGRPRQVEMSTPVASSWSPLLMPTRRVLVFGGFDGTADHLSTEILDTASMTFSSGPTMGVGRSGCAVAALDERRVLVAGGFDGCRSLDSTELVDPVTLKVVLGPKMGTRRNACAAVRLDAQRLLIIGGSDDASELDSTEVLDLERMVFSPGPRMGTRRNACAASLIDHHRLLVIGGSDGCSDLESTELLDLTTMSFSAGPRMSTRRNFCATALLQPSGSKGLLLVLGGSDGSNSLDSTEVLDVSKMTFSPGPQMSAWRSGCTCAPLGPQQLLVVGGFDGSNHLDSTEFLGANKKTLLAPTDEAFMALGTGVAASLLHLGSNTTSLALVELHIFEGARTSENLVARTNIVSQQGGAVNVGSLHPLTFNEAVASVQDVPCTNGILHVLDHVVKPKRWRFPERNFMQFANKELKFARAVERDLSEFVRLVSFSGLLTEFQGDGPFTAMIPNDYAFALLGDSVNNLFLPENSEKLKEEHDFMPSHNRVQEEFLRYHVVVGKFLSIQLTSPQDLNTLQGGVVSAVPWTQLGWTGIAYQSAAPPVVINERAQVVTPDILATNGVVHIIDHVCLGNESTAFLRHPHAVLLRCEKVSRMSVKFF